VHQYGKQGHLLDQTFLVAGALVTFDGKSWTIGSTSILSNTPVSIRHHISGSLVIAIFLVFDGMFFSWGLFGFTVAFCRSYLLIFII
jgi:hypothetical protein